MHRMLCLDDTSSPGMPLSSDWRPTITQLWDCIRSLRQLLFRRSVVVVTVLCTGQYVCPLPLHRTPLTGCAARNYSDHARRFIHSGIARSVEDWSGRSSHHVRLLSRSDGRSRGPRCSQQLRSRFPCPNHDVGACWNDLRTRCECAAEHRTSLSWSLPLYFADDDRLQTYTCALNSIRRFSSADPRIAYRDRSCSHSFIRRRYGTSRRLPESALPLDGGRVPPLHTVRSVRLLVHWNAVHRRSCLRESS